LDITSNAVSTPTISAKVKESILANNTMKYVHGKW
jgi:hypothetical protein